MGRAHLWFTDRNGGSSTGAYASNNLGDHVGDDGVVVAENRRRLAARLVLPDPSRWQWLQQVHGNDVVVVRDRPGVDPPRADSAITASPGVPLAVLVADCAPIAIVGERAVGVVHAGWAGLERGVVERAVDALREVEAQAGGDPSQPPRAVLGPCIHPARYEFGADDLERLVQRFGTVVSATTDHGTPAFDLPAAARVALARAGVDELIDLGVCTAASADHFSHRRDGVTGRQAVVAVLMP
ncbi:MAG: polyphenol oxidase family protein [Acidimicrobiia bacterium]